MAEVAMGSSVGITAEISNGAVISDEPKRLILHLPSEVIDASTTFRTYRGRGQAFGVVAYVLLLLFAMRDLTVL